MLYQLAESLVDMRKVNVNHRDLHTSNIMLAFESKIQSYFALSKIFDFSFLTEATDFKTVIIDFGMAKEVRDVQSMSANKGNMTYRAPEAVWGERSNGKDSSKSDVYSIGTIFIGLLCPEF